MKVSQLVTTIQAQLFDSGVHKTDTFVLRHINSGNKLLSLLTLYNEKSTTVDIDGTRNYGPLPIVSGEYCLAPLYVADTPTKSRINPTKMEEFEFHQSRWEGVVGTDTPHYYTTTGNWSPETSAIVFCPISNYGRTKYHFIGAYEPEDLISTDTLSLSTAQLRAIVEYVLFCAFVSMSGRAEEMLEHFQFFIKEVTELLRLRDRKFPSGRDIDPAPVELLQLGLERYQPKQAAEGGADEG
jgi:hypothetical protein